MSTQSPDRTTSEKIEMIRETLLEGARMVPSMTSETLSNTADQLRDRVIQSVNSIKDTSFVDHICSPPQMLKF
jgi:hypothetical protein